jgi:hypothetical protein
MNRTDFQRALDRGLRLHQSGALTEAEHVYRGLLDKGPPDTFTPLHMLGVVRAQLGHAQEGADLIGQALRLAPATATAWFNHANILAEIGRACGLLPPSLKMHLRYCFYDSGAIEATKRASQLAVELRV